MQADYGNRLGQAFYFTTFSVHVHIYTQVYSRYWHSSSVCLFVRNTLLAAKRIIAILYSLLYFAVKI